VRAQEATLAKEQYGLLSFLQSPSAEELLALVMTVAVSAAMFAVMLILEAFMSIYRVACVSQPFLSFKYQICCYLTGVSNEEEN